MELVEVVTTCEAVVMGQRETDNNEVCCYEIRS
jgi:hypothetical protein